MRRDRGRFPMSLQVMLDGSGRSQVEGGGMQTEGCGLLRHSVFRCAQSGCSSDFSKEFVVTLHQYEL